MVGRPRAIVAASRHAVEDGFRSHDYQGGQTGKLTLSGFEWIDHEDAPRSLLHQRGGLFYQQPRIERLQAESAARLPGLPARGRGLRRGRSDQRRKALGGRRLPRIGVAHHALRDQLGIEPGMRRQRALHQQPAAGGAGLAAEDLHAQALGMGIATVAAGADAFLVCHIEISLCCLSVDFFYFKNSAVLTVPAKLAGILAAF